MFYIETGGTDPCRNLAFEEYILKNKTQGEWLMLWQNANTVVIGLNQTAEEEVNRAYAQAHAVTVVRRKTGGGAVYHDLGNLNYSFISDTGPLEEMTLKHFTEPVCRALRSMGLNAECSGRNDILVDGKKVSGTAQRIEKTRILHHGTLLFDSDLDAAAAALNADPEKFRSKSTKSVRSRIGNIRAALKENMSLAEFKSRLLKEIAADSLVQCSLTAEELEEIDAMAELYRSREWTCGKSPRFGYTDKKRFPGGTLQVSVDVEKGLIKDIAFFGDFMAVRDNAPAVEALRGASFSPEDVRAALEQLPIADMFGGIGTDELCELMFG